MFYVVKFEEAMYVLHAFQKKTKKQPNVTSRSVSSATKQPTRARVEKIARGKLNKFFKENTLLNQQFVKDNSKTIATYLQDKDKDLTVTAFKHVELG